MFEKASRMKLRFVTSRGMATVEDLWDMPLSSRDGFNLDATAITVNEGLKLKAESFVEPKSIADSELALKLDILKHIIAVKLLEAKAKEDAVTRATRKQHILAIINDKQNAALKEKSIEELEKELDSL